MPAEPTTQSLIAADMQITGTIKCNGPVRIDGKLEGDLICATDAVIGKGAVIKGNLTINTVVIEGAINGNITAKDKIDMKSTAKVNGDIVAKRLAVEDGVTFIGRSEVNPAGSTAAGTAAAPASEPPAKEGGGSFFGRR